ncbi:MAG: prepilin-type N-terminal cleavage/methylation domain-containing protein [Tenericutes bacterium]|nr:prepilin-type N-terminal cleavage/methylation domain-containing protein [Mycoplasmatota bacterium]
MKEKGFTLIELLAVIVILSVITLITIPMITNVIEESKKKALASSVQGLVESANLYAIENDGVYEFLFDKEHKGSTIKGESLDYRGNIDGEGKLYLDKEGNVSICISNDTYYVYKNYNSEIIVGNKKTGNCIIGFDALTNKYVAMLDNGTGNVSNVYSKDEVNNLVDAKATELNNKITNNTNEITSMKSNIEELQNNLNNLSSLVGSNTESINHLNNKLNSVFININNKIKTVSLPSSVNPASYIAEEDCYIVAKIHGNNYQSGYLAIDGVRLYEWNNQSSTTMFFNTTQLVKKGQTVTIRNYGATGSYDIYGVQN